MIAELGILYCGAVNVPISVKIDELDDLKFRLLHAGCRMAIVSQGQVGKIRAIKNDLPDLKLTIVLDTLEAFEADEMPAAEVLRPGDAFLRDRRGQRSRRGGSRSRKATARTSATPPARRPTRRASS